MTRAWKQRLLAALVIAGAAAALLGLWQTGLLQRLSDRDQLIQSLRGAGVKGPLLCILVQFVQVVIFVIPGEITQFAAGYVFGGWMGFVYSLSGIMLGSAFNFFFARMVGRPLLQKLVARRTLEKVDAALNGA